ncbi:outer membrane protein assembly factor BamE [Pseudoalteromonas luteoviolacea]|uniref:Outer membrane protein assembly factor BamE n=1 Tax=Pseudoalteromonas luteoviolacea NCIMB 1942 TaxID=1365253 RepID=A0A167CQW8_9GAMM|nr:outer membrane protein assembly factor BamE [Pseudoalteromonas luteoviolacea]KZN47955.1 membrane protein [Pseudoalteromonas luteoviolacea NCIMB 1942]KZX00541.1 SmpA/OmlA domain-containing protein [Pseudoalteromonas luteoviolacea]
MQYNKLLLTWLTAAIMSVFLSGCSSWVYRINVPQGNFLEQSDIDKLRVQMSREQVMYVLGTPVAKDAFDSSKWHYNYVFNIDRGSEVRKSLTVYFENDKLVSISGDFEKPADFDIPLDQ